MKCLNCNNEAVITKAGKQSNFCSLSCRSKFNSANTLEKRKHTNIERYGVDNPSKNSSIIEMRNISNIEKYGVANPFSLVEIQEKQQKTMKEKYGVSFATQNSELNNKQKETWHNNYGGHPWANDVIKEKRNQTMLERYGSEHVFSSEILMNKIRLTNIEKYGSENPMLSNIIQEKLAITLLGEDTYKKLNDISFLQTTLSVMSPKMLSDNLGIHYKTLCVYLKKHNLYVYHKSSLENEITTLLEANGLEYTLNDRSIIKPLELDIVIPKLNKSIECNGSYWHSELQGRSKYYHLTKLKKCQEYGIDLFFIWEHLWYENNLLKNRLLNYLGLFTDKIQARKCIVQEISSKTKTDFLNENHLQKDIGSTYNIGLFYNDNLVSVMTFSKSRFNRTFDFELLRFCNRQGVSVAGAASRLFSYFIKDRKCSIISYSDNQYGSGKLYEILGFTKHHIFSPSYFYTKNYINFENRMKYQKHKLSNILPIFDSKLTEWQNMQNNGYDRIWDCGSTTWHYKTS